MTIATTDAAERLGLSLRSSLAVHLAEHGHLPASRGRHGSVAGSLVDEVERSGLRGRGGGWFPTAVKLRAVVESSAARGRLSTTRRPVVIGNGMEGEPASGKDAMLLAASPHLVLDGISAAAYAIGATEAYLAVHRGSHLVPGLLAALAERAEATVDEIAIRLVTPPARYVASEESALAHWVGEGVATPVHDRKPFQSGSGGRPTLVQNVETLAHLALIARNGGPWFAGAGSPAAPGTTMVSVGGAVAAPGVVEVPTGTSVASILDRCGGPTADVAGYLTGGYGGAWVPPAGFAATPWDPDSVREMGGVIGASVLWAVGPDTCPLHEMARVAAWMAGETAGQCGPCAFGLPSVRDDVHLLAVRRAGAGDADRLRSRLGLISNRGGCKHPDGTARFLATGLAAFPDEVAAHLAGRCSFGSTRPGSPSSLPVPEARLASADVNGRDFA
ncbi:MAG: NADH-ubiquinone oxidoreductase-F iron-sulfur binding region domain-containing protein [Actinomycetota bacterium]|nr:NADH-ubiquinone oxidoreductase-F iron-sulfur binding region domain-containing protein [Actinomycetota bacterium]